MKTFAAAALAGVSSAVIMTAQDYEFMRYVTKFEKFYETVEEFELRKKNFIATSVQVKMQNSQEESTYTAGLNQFSDWNDEEYNSMLGITEEPQEQETKWTGSPNTEGVDWRDDSRGVVTPVKDQG